MGDQVVEPNKVMIGIVERLRAELERYKRANLAGQCRLVDAEAVIKAARAFKVAFDAVLPAINSATAFMDNHGCPYTGRNIESEMKAIDDALAAYDSEDGDG